MTRFHGILTLLLLVTAAPLAAQGGGAAPGAYGVEQTWTSRDKLYHFGISAVGAGATYAVARLAGVKRWPAIGISVGLTGAAGLVREYQDSRSPGKYLSEKDLLWNAAGITIGIWVTDRIFMRGRRTEPPT